MICDPCKAGRHEVPSVCTNCFTVRNELAGRPTLYLCFACDGSGQLPGCKGGTWCDCQHRPSVIIQEAATASAVQ